MQKWTVFKGTLALYQIFQNGSYQVLVGKWFENCHGKFVINISCNPAPREWLINEKKLFWEPPTCEAAGWGVTVQLVELQSILTTLAVCEVTSKRWVPTCFLNAAGGVRLTDCYDRTTTAAFISLSEAVKQGGAEPPSICVIFQTWRGIFIIRQSRGAALVSASLSVERYISMLMDDAKGNDAWLSDSVWTDIWIL